jgi:hypothetical protein
MDASVYFLKSPLFCNLDNADTDADADKYTQRNADAVRERNRWFGYADGPFNFGRRSPKLQLSLGVPNFGN